MGGKGWLALAVTLGLWASAFVGIRAGLAGYEPGQMAFFRFLIASAALIPIALYKRISFPAFRDVPLVFLHGFLGVFTYHFALNLGERTVSAASACFLIGAIPVMMSILAWFFLGERPKPRAWAGVALSFAGVALIAFGEGESFSFEIGALYVLVAALAESLYYVLIKPYLKKYGTFEYTAYTFWAGTMLLAVFSPGLWNAVAEAPAGATLSVVYLGIFPAAIAYLCWNYALARGNIIIVGAAQYLMPGMTIVIGWVWLRESPNALALCGGLIALAGVVLTSLPPLSSIRLSGRNAP